MAVDEKVVEAKVAKGEELTKEETEFVMGAAPDPGADGEEIEEKDIEDIDEEKNKEKVPGAPKDTGKTDGPEKKEETAEEKAAREQKEKEDADAKAKADADAAAAAAKKAAEDKGLDVAKIEAEADKPDGQEDVKDFNATEKGLFYALRAARKRAQKAEEERDAVLFLQVKKDMAEKNKKPAEEEEDPEAFVSRADLKKREEKEALEKEARDRQTVIVLHEIDARSRVAIRRMEGEKDLPDFDKVLEIGEAIVNSNQKYKEKIFLAYKTGKNAALVMYDLVRNDPSFAEKYGKPAAEKSEEKKPEEKKPDVKTAEKINTNDAKAKTTGTVGAGGTFKVGEKEYSLTEIAAMSQSQFRKLPRSVREKFLQEAT